MGIKISISQTQEQGRGRQDHSQTQETAKFSKMVVIFGNLAQENRIQPKISKKIKKGRDGGHQNILAKLGHPQGSGDKSDDRNVDENAKAFSAQLVNRVRGNLFPGH